jgi:hypothetical protein
MKLNEGELRLWKFLRKLEGSFFTSLFEVIFKSDKDNRAKLMLGFPEEVTAVTRYQTELGYSDRFEEEVEL